jgi:hypothetical protein
MATLTAGCRKGPVPVDPARGKLFIGETPGEGAILVFHPVTPVEGLKVRPSSKVHKDGSFQVTTYQRNDGCPAGEYVVTVVASSSRKSSPFKKKGGPAFTIDPLYAKPETSKLRATITAGAANEIPEFRLP